MRPTTALSTTLLFFALAIVSTAHAADTQTRALTDKVTVLRTPNRGIQPQAATDAEGALHLIYYSGDPKAGDVYYTRADDGTTFSAPLRVNSQPGSVIAMGNVRGAHLALGKNGRPHVAWMGAAQAQPRGPKDASPMLYSRLNDAGTAFEPQRNVITSAYGLDGGGSVAADAAGKVYVLWHAPAPGEKGEENRCIWIACSSDEGKTFAPETRANEEATGACGCCGMRAFADRQGAVYALYRSASSQVNRDMHLLVSTAPDQGERFRGEKLQSWKISTCPMSTAALAESGQEALAAWETDGQVWLARIDRASGRPSSPVAAPSHGKKRKHPALAGNASGEAILVWTEGMGWNQGGSLAWQIFDRPGKPVGQAGRAEGVPVWSLPTAVARPDGSFVIIY